MFLCDLGERGRIGYVKVCLRRVEMKLWFILIELWYSCKVWGEFVGSGKDFC